ncbi:MAG: WYL domain-containing protein [Thermomicrobiales bacterium]|nr:WYL domain-containing protein [Thermomicrobiales bacterium]
MHRSLRMLGILIDLQAGSRTLAQLAAKYECSTKTIQRDISSLTELNIPVHSAAGANGGIWLDATWTLSPLNLTADEIETVILALENAVYLPAAEETLAKIRAAAKPNYFDSVAESPVRPHAQRIAPVSMPSAVDQLRKVMHRELWCRIDYSGGSTPGWRIVLPREIHLLEGRWYLWAIDERSRDSRNFRVDRIRDIAPTLAPAHAADIIVDAASRPHYQSETYPEIVVDLNAAGIQFCRDHSHFHKSTRGQQLRFRCPPGEYRYVARELLRMETNCRVLAPPALIEAMRDILNEIGQHLDSSQDITMS